MQSFVKNGGQIWVCGACAKPRGITDKDLVEGAKIVTAASAVEYLASGAASLSF
jgi:predicted peroxiredoxin